MNSFYTIQDTTSNGGDILYWNNNSQSWDWDFNNATQYQSTVLTTPLPNGTTEVWEFDTLGNPIAIHKIAPLSKIS